MVIIPYFPISARQLMIQNYWNSFLKQRLYLALALSMSSFVDKSPSRQKKK
jgi:hypothetical protein